MSLHGGEPVRTTRLPYGRQWLDEDDIAAVVDVLRSDWLTTGPKVSAFEAEFAATTGAVVEGNLVLVGNTRHGDDQPGDPDDYEDRPELPVALDLTARPKSKTVTAKTQRTPKSERANRRKWMDP